MFITALAVCSENADHYCFVMKTKRKPSDSQIKRFLRDEHDFYLNYEEGMNHQGFENGEIEVGFINAKNTIKI